MRRLYRFLLAALFVAGPMTAFADEASDLADMQRQLNANVMAKPFDPGDAAKVDAFVKEAMKKDLKPPVTKAPTFWRSGYTCRDVYRYGYAHYRNCVHYHRYYGRYW